MILSGNMAILGAEMAEEIVLVVLIIYSIIFDARQIWLLISKKDRLS